MYITVHTYNVYDMYLFLRRYTAHTTCNIQEYKTGQHNHKQPRQLLWTNTI
jgi:hypothetical protein